MYYYLCGHTTTLLLPQNGTCVCVEECEVESCEVECGDNGECVKVEGESDSCECVDGYSYDGKLCVKDPVEDPRSGELLFLFQDNFNFDVCVGEK